MLSSAKKKKKTAVYIFYVLTATYGVCTSSYVLVTNQM